MAWFKLSSKPLPPKASVSHVTSLTIATLSAGGSINTISDLALAAEAVATTASGQLAGPSGGTTSDQPQQQRQMEVEGASAAPQAVVDGRNPSPLPQPSADGDGGGRRAGGGTPSPAAPGDGRAAAEGGGEEVAVGGGGSVAAVQDSWFLARAFSHLPAARVRSEHLEGWDIGEISRVSEQQHYAIYTKVSEGLAEFLRASALDALANAALSLWGRRRVDTVVCGVRAEERQLCSARMLLLVVVVRWPRT